MQRVEFILKEELLAIRRFNELQQRERELLLYENEVEELLVIQQAKNKVLSLIEDIEEKRKRVFEDEGILDRRELSGEAKGLMLQVAEELRKLEVMREYNLSLLREKMSFNLKYLEALKEELKEQFDARAVAFDQKV